MVLTPIAAMYAIAKTQGRLDREQAAGFLKVKLAPLVPEITDLEVGSFCWQGAVVKGLACRAAGMRTHLRELLLRPQEDPTGTVAEQYDGEWLSLMYHVRLLDKQFASGLPDWKGAGAWEKIERLRESSIR